MPRGALNILTGDAKAIGDALVKSELVRLGERLCGR
jgi:acyl-CoA reductase-like NAD-dependent aldehyde dehydrogenase